MSRIDSLHRKFSTGHHFQNGRHNTAKIQHLCSIVAAILKMATGRNFSMSGINSGHHYLPTYKILMISDNVEFLPLIFMPCFGSHFENGRHLENFENTELPL
jgi:5-carboxymethyl-2-hydroxymuconate isomerase